jgi:hypothetical protein
MNRTQTPAQFLAAQFLAAYEEAERTGKQIEEIARFDLLADVARQTLADEENKAAADLLAPSWRNPADAPTTIEFARMAQMDVIAIGADAPVVEVCDYVIRAVRAFEARYRNTEWGEDDAPDWMDATAEHWSEYTAAHAPPWDTDDARREREAEKTRAELRASGYHVTGMDGCVEIRNRDTGAAVVTMECHGDGTCDVENHDAQRSERNVPIATMLTYARLMVRA